MDSPILPILIGGGVLAAVVLGSRRASAQDRDAGGAGGASDTGGLNFDGGGAGGDTGGGGGGGGLVWVPDIDDALLPSTRLFITVRNDVPPESEVVVKGYGTMQDGGRRVVFEDRFDTRRVQTSGRLELSAVPPGFYMVEARMGGRRVSNLVRANVQLSTTTSLLLTGA